MDEVITSRFPEELVKKMDKAISRGLYRSRSDALRAIVEAHLREHPSLFLGEGAQELIDNAPDMSDEEVEALAGKIFHGLSVVEIVAEGRDRA